MRQDPPPAIENVSFAKIADHPLGGEETVKLLAAAEQLRRGAVQIPRHGQNIAPDTALMLDEIGIRDMLGFRQRRAHGFAEPSLDNEAEKYRGKHRNDNRRRQGDNGEPEHQTGMQPRSDRAAPARDPHRHQAAGDHREQQQKQNEIEAEQERDRPGVGSKLQGPGQRRIGHQRGGQRHQRQRHGKFTAEPHFARPIRQAFRQPRRGR